jgi:hypothetical protein
MAQVWNYPELTHCKKSASPRSKSASPAQEEHISRAASAHHRAATPHHPARRAYLGAATATPNTRPTARRKATTYRGDLAEQQLARHQAAARGQQGDHLPAAMLNQAVRNPTRAWRFLQRAALRRRATGQELQQQTRRKSQGRTATTSTWISRFEPAFECYPRLRQIADSWQQPPIISVLMPTYNSDVGCSKRPSTAFWARFIRIGNCASPTTLPTHRRSRRCSNVTPRPTPRIQVVFRTVNGHISAASNSALALASGDFVALLDHDDLLHPLALWFVAQCSIEHPEAGLIYTDEDKLAADGQRCGPVFQK